MLQEHVQVAKVSVRIDEVPTASLINRLASAQTSAGNDAASWMRTFDLTVNELPLFSASAYASSATRSNVSRAASTLEAALPIRNCASLLPL